MKKQTKHAVTACAAVALTIGASMTSLAAVGWQKEGGIWRYYDGSGNAVTECWKRSGANWYWLDENGEMAVSQLIDDDGDYYYVNEYGTMVGNQWRELPNEDPDDDEGETSWYYFGPNGKAFKASNSGKTTFKTIVRADGQSKRYAFDEEGKMLYGWVDEESKRVTGEDDWINGTYYMGEAGDGALRENEWAWLEAEDEDQEDDEYEGYYWFYFKNSGKKMTDATKTINGKKYRFEENGNAVFNWYATPSDASNPNDMFYSQPSDSWLSTGWFYTVPGEALDPEGHSDGEPCWFYAEKNGEILKSQIKKIGGYYYAFDEYGKMMEGLYKMSVNDREIQSYEKIESEGDLPEADEAWSVYYFGGNSKAGAMKTGTATIEIDGERYAYSFHKTSDERGQGINGIEDGCIYLHGRRLQAEKDAKLEVIDWEGENAGRYLVNTTGKIQKKKKNTRDGDDRYVCTDAQGIVIYQGSEKCEHHSDSEAHD